VSLNSIIVATTAGGNNPNDYITWNADHSSDLEEYLKQTDFAFELQTLKMLRERKLDINSPELVRVR
jgi:hypothetical protein